jgi:hypothetical protein
MLKKRSPPIVPTEYCTIHKDLKATHFCDTCNEKQCPTCFEQHSSSRPTHKLYGCKEYAKARLADLSRQFEPSSLLKTADTLFAGTMLEEGDKMFEVFQAKITTLLQRDLFDCIKNVRTQLVGPIEKLQALAKEKKYPQVCVELKELSGKLGSAVGLTWLSRYLADFEHIIVAGFNEAIKSHVLESRELVQPEVRPRFPAPFAVYRKEDRLQFTSVQEEALLKQLQETNYAQHKMLYISSVHAGDPTAHKVADAIKQETNITAFYLGTPYLYNFLRRWSIDLRRWSIGNRCSLERTFAT